MAGAFNQVRYRAGLPGADAGELVDATSFNELIRRERMVEFPPRKPPLLRHLPLGHFRGTGTRAADGPERRSRKMGGILRPDGHLVPYDPRTDIQVKYMFMPLHRNELRKVPSLDQRPGWEK